MNKKTIIKITAGYLAIIIFTFAAVIIFGKSYTAYVENRYDSYKISLEYSNDGIVENTDIRTEHGITSLSFKALKSGTSQVTASIISEENELNNTTISMNFKVLSTGVIYLEGYDFGGYQFIILGMALFVLYSFAICFMLFRRRKKVQFFSYKTVLDLALIVFFGLQGLMYLGLFGGVIAYPLIFDGWRVYNLAGLIMMYIFVLSIPVLIIIAVFLSLSNLSLIRHEGFRRNNLFGILISLMLFAGSLLCVIVTVRNPISTDMDLTGIRDAAIRVTVSTAFVYFECILFATQYCTQYAAKHVPKYNQDFIIILGCKVGSDGTPMPLLKGRIDKAIEFYHKQLDATGKQACFIPSGGKGSDEVISEAECMKNYLIGQGIDESIIYPETESATTLENMRFSKRIADEHKENANILFATTNYHIFRSGILSAKAGIKADDIGAKTKWYFWPNAQIREFIGLMASEWKINLLYILIIILLSTLFANIGAIIDLMVK